MKQKLILLIISLIFFEFAGAQNTWTYNMYQKTDYKNFRSKSIFNQKYNKDNPDIPLLDAALFFLTNEKRKARFKKILKYHKACETAAYNHSKQMAEKDFFSHQNTKDKKRRSTEQRAKLAGIKNPYIAENIAFNHFIYDNTYLEIAEKLINQWMNSKGHRENILAKDAKSFGCGVYISGTTIWATQVYQWFYEIKEQPASDKLPPVVK